MGVLVSKLLGVIMGNKEVRVLILGLDNAGKTTILYKLQMGEVVTTVPTIGFNVETVQCAVQFLRRAIFAPRNFCASLRRRRIRPRPPRRLRPHHPHRSPPPSRPRRYKNLRFQVWDLGGQTSIRPYWRCYYQNTNAVIYVVDSADTERMGISKQELVTMLEEEELKDAALMVFANKQDLPNAATAEVIAEKLGLSALKNRQWQIFKTSALKGDGLYDGLDWLISTLRDK